jgi:hypothetical protein
MPAFNLILCDKAFHRIQNKGNNKITELRTILQRKVKNHKYINTKSVNNRKPVTTVMTLTWYRDF